MQIDLVELAKQMGLAYVEPFVYLYDNFYILDPNEEVEDYQVYFYGVNISKAILEIALLAVAVAAAGTVKAALKGIKNADKIVDGLKSAGKIFKTQSAMKIVTINGKNYFQRAGCNLKYSLDFETHMINGTIHKKLKDGVNGGHNMTEFTKTLDEIASKVGVMADDLIISKTPHPTINGIYEITYKVPMQKSGNIFVEGKYITSSSPKTVYDPSIISDSQIIAWGEEAMEYGFNNGNISRNEIYGVASNGLKFTGYLESGSTDIVKNFFPTLK